MIQCIKLVILENNKVINTVKKDTSTQPADLVQSLQEFQRDANAALTALIENLGGSGDTMEAEEVDETDDDEEEDIPVSPKKKKK